MDPSRIAINLQETIGYSPLSSKVAVEVVVILSRLPETPLEIGTPFACIGRA